MFKIFIICLTLLFIYFYIVSLNYKNPYKLIMIFGKKGSGKDTLLSKLAIQYQHKGYKVFSDSNRFNCFKLDTNWIGKYDFPKNSVLMVSEAGITWDNRNFKSFSSEVRNFFKLQRHYNIIVYLASQSFDVDKKLRDLTDEMYLCTNYMGIFSIAKSINKRIAIHNASENNDGESFLTETYSFGFPWEWKYTYIPRWVKFFNSFDVPYNNLKVPREKFRFNNENELYKQTFYKYYKLYQISDFIQNTKVKISRKIQNKRCNNYIFYRILNSDYIPIG